MAKRKRRPPRNRPKLKPFTPDFPLFSPSSPQTEAEDKELSPVEKRWLEFEAADYEGQIALCEQTIEEKSLMDAEMAFEMFNTLFYKLVEHNERHRFEALANKLHERLPDVFAQEAHYILDWQITNALAEGRIDDVLPLARALAPTAGEHLETFTLTLDQLDYHGQLDIVLEMTAPAWPEIKESPKGYFDWALNEFAARATDYVVFGCLERNPQLEADDPELQEKVGVYMEEINQTGFANFIDRLTGRVEGKWVLSDFGFERDPQGKQKGAKPQKTGKLSEKATQNLYNLIIEFLRYLRYKEGVPFTKGRLASEQIYQYLLKRHAGELAPRESMFEAMMRGPRRPKPKPKLPYPDHWLCPDRNTLDHFLASFLDFLGGSRYHEAVATFELVPAWLRFLKSRQFIAASQYDKTLHELHGLDTEFLKVLKGHSDPALPRAIEQWWEKNAV